MIKHTHTEPTELNFSKLEERIMQVNDPYLSKYNDIRKMLYDLTIDNKPTLIMATGGSKVIAYYLQLIIERLGLTGIICEVIEPRDYFYKANRDMFSNLIAISASGNTNGISEALLDFRGNKYLITENKKRIDLNSIHYSYQSSSVSFVTKNIHLSIFSSINLSELSNLSFSGTLHM